MIKANGTDGHYDKGKCYRWSIMIKANATDGAL